MGEKRIAADEGWGTQFRITRRIVIDSLQSLRKKKPALGLGG